ncbi:MAG: glycine dehydrogenase subunit 2 [Myxococcales bacterium]|nr:MAG: glycine dehydrogenase subunit 2 [Myxococcales bacterium]
MTTNLPGASGLVLEENLVFEQGSPDRVGYSLPKSDVPDIDPKAALGAENVREQIAFFPELAENEVMRHFVRLSQWNYGVDSGFYPLGSCTMKYNPKINEDMSRLAGFLNSHPAWPAEMAQGNLELMHRLEAMLAEIAGMDATTLQPAAGAHGELTGLMLIRAYHIGQGRKRSKILVPDSAHGTNPASSALCGFDVVEVKSGPNGHLVPEAVAEAMTEDVAALMITNPNTLGIFEKHVGEIAAIVHAKGGLMYNDGANMNALVGVARPGDMGFDVIQYNLHKTFSTPHGGGGPGAGPVAVKKILEPFLPVPRIVRKGDEYSLDWNRPQTIGKVKGHMANFGVLVRAYTYIREIGQEHMRRIAELAVLNANYIRAMLKDRYKLAYCTPSMHEVVFTDKNQKDRGVTTMDIAKRLLDLGFHAPTVYFPLIVHAAMMIEPTESESKQSCDQFIAAMAQIDEETKTDAEAFHGYPRRTFRRRLDDVQAARKPVLRWRPE